MKYVPLFICLLFSVVIAGFAQTPGKKVPATDPLKDQRISITIKNAPLRQILEYLQTNYAINFSYAETLDLNMSRTMSIHRLALEQAMEKLLLNTEITFVIIADQVVLKKRPAIGRADSLFNPRDKDSLSGIKNLTRPKVPESKTSGTIKKYNAFFELFRKKTPIEKAYLKYRHQQKDEKTIIIIHSTDSTVLSSDTIKPKYRKITRPGRPASEKKQTSVFIEAGVHPEYSFRTVSSKQPSGTTTVESKDKYESARNNVSFQITLNHFFSSRFYMGIGFSIMNTGLEAISVKYTDTRFRDSNIVRTTTKFSEKWTYAGIPLQLGFNIIKRQLTFNIHAGISPLLLTAHSIKEKSLEKDFFKEEEERDNRPFPQRGGNNILLLSRIESANPPSIEVDKKNDRKFILYYQVGISAGLHLTQRWELFLAPVYRASLTSIYTNDIPVSQKPYGIGILGGLRIHL
jgi:hypothetical protein